jgi:hypothetical protein
MFSDDNKAEMSLDKERGESGQTSVVLRGARERELSCESTSRGEILDRVCVLREESVAHNTPSPLKGTNIIGMP